jgi:hypothetical protein
MAVDCGHCIELRLCKIVTSGESRLRVYGNVCVMFCNINM